MTAKATPGKRSEQIIELIGTIISSSNAATILKTQYGIPDSVVRAANHQGIWDVTALLPYLINAT